MENSPLDPTETRHDAAQRARERIDARRRTRADTIFIRRIKRCGTPAGRSVGKTQDGTSDQEMHRQPMSPPTGSSGACRAAGCIARSCHAGGRFERPGAGATRLRAPFDRTAAGPSRATSRRGAHFTPGGADRRGIGGTGVGNDGTGGKAIRATRRRRRSVRPSRRARQSRQPAAQSHTGHAAGSRRGTTARASWAAQNPCIVTVGLATRCTTP